jgi:CubicO group peptidase (beta-lactamase class C family)
MRYRALTAFTCAAILGAAGLTAADLSGNAVAAPPAGEITPTGVQYAVSQLTHIIDADQAATGIPGLAAAVVYDGKVVYAKGFGVREVGKPAKVDTNTVFQLASVSKPITSTVISAAATKGKLSWDEPVRQGLPTFTLKSPYVSTNVTLADMYSHRSGLPDHAGDLLEDLGYSQSAIFNKLRQEPLTPFRTEWAYTNYGLTAAGESAANVTGQSFEQFAQNLLFEPLGMTSTSTTFAALSSRTDRAALHKKINGVWTPNLSFDVDRQAPAGGVSSSVNDLTKWVTMLLNQGTYNGQRIVDVNDLLRVWNPNIVSAPASTVGGGSGFYGLGWNVTYDATNQLTVDHSGAFSTGAATNVLLLPSSKLGIITLTNGFPVGLPEAINRSFVDDAKYGHQTRDWLAIFQNAYAGLDQLNDQYDTPPKVVSPARPLSDYTGIYNSTYWGPITVSEQNGKLSFVAGPAQERFALIHYTGDVFYFVTRGESQSGQSGMTFAGGGSGKASRVTVQAWDASKLGTFTR